MAEQATLLKKLNESVTREESANESIEQAERHAQGLQEQLEATRHAAQEHSSKGGELAARLEQVQCEAREQAAKAQQRQEQAQREASKKTAEVARLKKECTVLTKQVDEGKRLLLALRDDQKQAEAQLIEGIEKANTAAQEARSEAQQRGNEAAARSLTMEKLHLQLKQIQEAAKSSASEAGGQVTELKREVAGKNELLRECQAQLASTTSKFSTEEKKRRDAEAQAAWKDERWTDAQQELKGLILKKEDLAARLQAQTEELNTLRRSSKSSADMQAESEQWQSQLATMENLMLKLSDNIRNKEIQVKQLQDTVHAECHERRELQETVLTLKERLQQQEEVPCNANAKSHSSNGSRSKGVQLPAIDSSRRRMQSG